MCGLPRTLCEYFVAVLSVLCTLFVLIFHCINFFSSAVTPCHVLIRVKSSRMRVKDLQTVAWRKKSRNFNSGVSFGKPEFLKPMHLISFSGGLWIVYMLEKSWTFRPQHRCKIYIKKRTKTRRNLPLRKWPSWITTVASKASALLLTQVTLSRKENNFSTWKALWNT